MRGFGENVFILWGKLLGALNVPLKRNDPAEFLTEGINQRLTSLVLGLLEEVLDQIGIGDSGHRADGALIDVALVTAVLIRPELSPVCHLEFVVLQFPKAHTFTLAVGDALQLLQHDTPVWKLRSPRDQKLLLENVTVDALAETSVPETTVMDFYCFPCD